MRSCCVRFAICLFLPLNNNNNNNNNNYYYYYYYYYYANSLCKRTKPVKRNWKAPENSTLEGIGLIHDDYHRHHLLFFLFYFSLCLRYFETQRQPQIAVAVKNVN